MPKLEDGVAEKDDKKSIVVGKHTLDDILEMQEDARKNLFKRGGMMFDDYNYRNFNKYVLVDPENPGAGETTSQGSEDDGYYSSPRS